MSSLLTNGVLRRLNGALSTPPRFAARNDSKFTLCLLPRTKNTRIAYLYQARNFLWRENGYSHSKYFKCIAFLSIGSLAVYIGSESLKYFEQKSIAYAATSNAVAEVAKDPSPDEDNGSRRMTRREMRFNEFASCEYNGQVLMTPQDFLESLTENRPKFARTGKVKLRERDIDEIVVKTPSIKDGSDHFFRSLHQNGIITFSEYLFLVTILTKSHHGLKIAFKMIDVDGNHQICKGEFHAVEDMINRSATNAVRPRSEKKHRLDSTTLLVHLFGRDGKQTVSFGQFFRFMENLQNEVLELEFHEFSKSMMTISELDFARILLRNTVLTKDEYRGYLDRLRDRIPEPKGVSLDQFKAFNRFLNNMDDFSIAVKMFSTSHEPISKEAFQRAVKVSTGQDIDPNIINVVFNLFDIDGDGKLSHVEFTGIMKDRLKRGFGIRFRKPRLQIDLLSDLKSITFLLTLTSPFDLHSAKFPAPRGWAGFKHCMRKEVHKS